MARQGDEPPFHCRFIVGFVEGLHPLGARYGFVTRSRSRSCLSLAMMTSVVALCIGPIGRWLVGGPPSEVGSAGSLAYMLGNDDTWQRRVSV